MTGDRDIRFPKASEPDTEGWWPTAHVDTPGGLGDVSALPKLSDSGITTPPSAKRPRVSIMKDARPHPGQRARHSGTPTSTATQSPQEAATKVPAFTKEAIAEALSKPSPTGSPVPTQPKAAQPDQPKRPQQKKPVVEPNKKPGSSPDPVAASKPITKAEPQPVSKQHVKKQEKEPVVKAEVQSTFKQGAKKQGKRPDVKAADKQQGQKLKAKAEKQHSQTKTPIKQGEPVSEAPKGVTKPVQPKAVDLPPIVEITGPALLVEPESSKPKQEPTLAKAVEPVQVQTDAKAETPEEAETPKPTETPRQAETPKQAEPVSAPVADIQCTDTQLANSPDQPEQPTQAEGIKKVESTPQAELTKESVELSTPAVPQPESITPAQPEGKQEEVVEKQVVRDEVVQTNELPKVEKAEPTPRPSAKKKRKKAKRPATRPAPAFAIAADDTDSLVIESFTEEDFDHPFSHSLPHSTGKWDKQERRRREAIDRNLANTNAPLDVLFANRHGEKQRLMALQPGFGRDLLVWLVAILGVGQLMMRVWAVLPSLNTFASGQAAFQTLASISLMIGGAIGGVLALFAIRFITGMRSFPWMIGVILLFGVLPWYGFGAPLSPNGIPPLPNAIDIIVNPVFTSLTYSLSLVVLAIIALVSVVAALMVGSTRRN